MKKYTVILWLLIALPLFAQQLDLSKIPGAKVMVPIIERTIEGEYHDTLYYTAEEFAKLTLAKVNADKAQRVNNWIAFVKTASKAKPIEPTKEEPTAQREELQKRIEALDLQIKAKEVKVIK